MKKTCHLKYGVDYAAQDKQIAEKTHKTKLKKYGTLAGDLNKIKTTWQSKSTEDMSNIIEKRRNTSLNRYGVDNPVKAPEIKEKIKNTCLDRYGVTSFCKTKEYLEKVAETNKAKYGNEIYFKSEAYWEARHKNDSFKTSKPEEYIYEKLLTKFKKVKRQYKSKQYPFECDFYVPETKLYIEFQGTWTHGFKPFSQDKECLDRLEQLKQRFTENNSKYYKAAIDVWTQRDPMKREMAKKNNLNWIEFFTLKEFDQWFENLS